MKKLLLILIICLSFSSAFAQGKLLFFADYAVFRYSENKSTVEVYFSVNQSDLKYDFTNGEFVGQANIQINILDKISNKVVFNDVFALLSKVTDTSQTKLKNKLIGQQNFTLPTSEYVVKVTGSDFNNKSKSVTVQFDFKLSNYDAQKTTLSEIQLASSYSKSTDNQSIFYKNGCEITPNPESLFGMNLNSICYYFEVYSLTKEFTSDNLYVVFTVIDSSSNNTVIQNIKHEKSRSEAFFEIGKIDIDSLTSGKYLLKVKMLDSTTGFYKENSKLFYVYNKSKNNLNESSDEKSYLISEYKTMSKDNVDDEYDKSIYIRNTPETEEYAKLKTLDEKRKFLFNFWKKRKVNQNSPVNDFKVEYFKRVNDANKYYKQGFMDGWKTDKGRIYVIYGRPSEIENHPNEADSKAYEIWSFNNLQGNAICVFAEDEIGGGIFHLIHSTIRGEFSDSDWKTKLKK